MAIEHDRTNYGTQEKSVYSFPVTSLLFDRDRTSGQKNNNAP